MSISKEKTKKDIQSATVTKSANRGLTKALSEPKPILKKPLVKHATIDKPDKSSVNVS